jgi:hypothetical protein
MAFVWRETASKGFRGLGEMEKGFNNVSGHVATEW